MRILTVKQPWAWAIIHGGKDVENRVRNLAGDYRGDVAIHVGLNYAIGIDSNELDEVMTDWYGDNPDKRQRPWLTGVGTIIGVVNLWDVHQDRDDGDCCPDLSGGGVGRDGSAWAERDVWHLCLTDPRPLDEPLPYKGGLGLRRLPTDVAATVLARARRTA